MRKIASIIFASLLLITFSSTESYAFFGKIFKMYENSNPDCKKYDLRCKRKSKKMTKEEVEELYPEKKKANKKIKRIEYEEQRREAKKRRQSITSENDTEFNFFTGLFDFSDDKQKSSLLGIQHQDEDLYKNSKFGKISPITGGFLTENNAFYLYSGIQAEYEIGKFKFTPSFAPGYYHYGNGKDLGLPLEFKTEVQLSVDLFENSQLGMSYNHISNASLGSKNPGANSYMFNFLKQF
jgi:lipid A 3-O-deacylase